MHLWTLGVVLLFTVSRLPIIDSRVAKHLPSRDEIDYSIDKRHRKLVQTKSKDGIHGTYIIHLKDDLSDKDVEERAEEIAAKTGGKILWTYKEVFKGFAISQLDSYEVVAKLLDHDDVEVVDQVCIFYHYGSCML
jgi:hypothetical protein